ncbi:hypothetical protein [Chryseobacterium daeguense]|uniref:hypothetical protein n=1 Tax=Chryseobacterium daeguense TaxID=412438 RepID=UPI0003FFD7AE|nr:hypothetical protein [Chryseobacterium daeguense]
MEGNFRIVQTADDCFIIQKEVDGRDHVPVKFLGFVLWDKSIPVKRWRVVTQKGIPANIYNLPEIWDAKWKTLEEAQKAYDSIKKYPKVVYGAITLEDLKSCPPPPEPQKPRSMRQGESLKRIIPETTPEQRSTMEFF